MEDLKQAYLKFLLPIFSKDFCSEAIHVSTGGALMIATQDSHMLWVYKLPACKHHQHF